MPALVIEAPEGPINSPPHAANLATVIGSSRLASGLSAKLPITSRE